MHLRSNYNIDIYIFCYVTKGPYLELSVGRCGCLWIVTSILLSSCTSPRLRQKDSFLF